MRICTKMGRKIVETCPFFMLCHIVFVLMVYVWQFEIWGQVCLSASSVPRQFEQVLQIFYVAQCGKSRKAIPLKNKYKNHSFILLNT